MDAAIGPVLTETDGIFTTKNPLSGSVNQPPPSSGLLTRWIQETFQSLPNS